MRDLPPSRYDSSLVVHVGGERHEFTIAPVALRGAQFVCACGSSGGLPAGHATLNEIVTAFAHHIDHEIRDHALNGIDPTNELPEAP